MRVQLPHREDPLRVVDQDITEAMANSFLGTLPRDVFSNLIADGDRVDYPAGAVIYREGSSPRAALVVTGVVRVYMSSTEGRQVTVRYARPNDVLGIAVMVGGPVNVSVQALEASSLFSVNLRTLTAAAQADARVAWAIAEELNRRLYETLQQTAINAFGSVKQRVAAHLLDLASMQQRPGTRLTARVTQQELADAVGSVREVIARVLRDLRVAGIVATSTDRILVLDPGRLHGESS
jgi:CRP/FNR family cyclic AMP-dependent transcriptional regulator